MCVSKRLKDVAQQQYTQKEAEWAAGKSTEVLPKVRLTSEKMES